MRYTAKDGRRFNNTLQGRRYDDWLRTQTMADKSKGIVEQAPGGVSYEDMVFHHGLAKKVTIEREGNGRTRVTSIHSNGERFTEVHPETYRAHDVARELLGIAPPPGIQTHSRARSQPSGPKEWERISKEDSREEEEET